MKTVSLLLISAAFAGCAQNKYHDREKDSPLYHEGQGIPVTPNVSVGGVGQRANVQVPSYSNADAVIGLVEAGISLAAYPDYYKPSTVSGKCVIGENTIEQVPCRHTGIVLIDANHKVVGSADTNDQGAFAFYVKKGKLYELTIKDSRYQLVGEPPKRLSMGTEVVVRAEPKPR